jgi:hypothetical protein
VVGTAYVSGERAWRNVKTGGGVDLLVAEAIVKVIM